MLLFMSLVLLATCSYCHGNETFTRFERLFVMVSGTEIDHNVTRYLSLCSSTEVCKVLEFNDNTHQCKLLSHSLMTHIAVESTTYIFQKAVADPGVPRT